MIYSIKSPEIFQITDAKTHEIFYGGDQEWYDKFWWRKSGCGPTTASNLTAYLAYTNSDFASLYEPLTLSKQDFVKHMKVLFTYITPGVGGVNHVSKFTGGLTSFFEERNQSIDIHTLSIDDKDTASRNPKLLENFVVAALLVDCPIAFLVLSQGSEVLLQNWHWITITSVEVFEDKIIALASDEGEKHSFDLLKWYMTTKMHGGLVYITPGKAIAQIL